MAQRRAAETRGAAAAVRLKREGGGGKRNAAEALRAPLGPLRDPLDAGPPPPAVSGVLSETPLRLRIADRCDAPCSHPAPISVYAPGLPDANCCYRGAEGGDAGGRAGG